MSSARKLTLISRSYCHLCEEMAVALQPLATEFGVEVDVLDVDADPALTVRYDELVPVLLHGGRELCHYVLDVAKVRDYLSEIS
ncbi:MAG TPA: glutaredoxin family protein [Accumulibacter sp.]|jgi:thioredoxin reductase (NADPH)|nr:glutaredoxin family protein [Accumulibacter sp.]HQC79453.1 glutaredoxin family protein [Accumulibacter sp.]